MTFQAIEREVDGTQGRRPSCGVFQLARNRDAVSVVAQAQNREHDHQLIVREETWHLYIKYE